MYVFHTIDNIHWFHQFLWDSSNKLTLTIGIHFLSCDLYERKQNLKNTYLTFTIILSCLEENQKPFLAQ